MINIFIHFRCFLPMCSLGSVSTCQKSLIMCKKSSATNLRKYQLYAVIHPGGNVNSVIVLSFGPLSHYTLKITSSRTKNCEVYSVAFMHNPDEYTFQNVTFFVLQFLVSMYLTSFMNLTCSLVIL